MIQTLEINIPTQGNCHIIDFTEQVQNTVNDSQLREGTVVLFHVGSTGALTTLEFEPGLVEHDIEAAFEKIAPQSAVYQHEKTWHDDNGHSHIRASLLGPSLCVPFVEGKLVLGTWQQIVLVDFDTRPRKRKIICQIIGE